MSGNRDRPGAERSRRRSEGRRGSVPGAGGADVRAALARLEQAVERLAATAGDAIAGRAASYINDAADRLERDFAGGRPRRRRRHRPRERRWPLERPPAERLRRDARRGKIAGVCAGIASYYGAQPWVVRCIALTGLIFLPSIVFPAYWILFFVMSRPGEGGAKGKRSAAPHAGQGAQAAEAPEWGAGISPRRSLRNVQAALMQAELRLRRMEFHVTSGQYDLHKEFNELGAGERPD